jgi:hypothetical protein
MRMMDKCQECSRDARWLALTRLHPTGLKKLFFCNEHKELAPKGAVFAPLFENPCLIYVGRGVRWDNS